MNGECLLKEKAPLSCREYPYTNKPDKFEKIYKYIKLCHNVNIQDVLNIGVEKIKNFDNFYAEWLKYLESK